MTEESPARSHQFVPSAPPIWVTLLLFFIVWFMAMKYRAKRALRNATWAPWGAE